MAPTLNSSGIMCLILGCVAAEMKIPAKGGSVPSYFHRERISNVCIMRQCLHVGKWKPYGQNQEPVGVSPEVFIKD